MPRPALHRTPFGTTEDGEPVDLWELRSAGGVRAGVLTYGGILHSLDVPDAAGTTDSVVLALPSVREYERRSPYFGALIGRYANRIGAGRFTLDGRTYQVPVNDGRHALHGGPDGFDRRVWRAEPLPGGRVAALRLSLHSPDGDMGFPGSLHVSATYTLDSAGTLALEFRAVTDRPTVVNLTNHSYFNLAGAGSGDVLGHLLRLDADRYLPVSSDTLPLGPLRPVSGTAFDFTSPRDIGSRIDEGDEQLEAAGGYDHCWALRTPAPAGLPHRAACLTDPGSGRRMEVWTTLPGLQVYTGNRLDGSLGDGAGRRYGRYGAVCLETQHFPDSPNHCDYPSTVLRPGERYRSRTEFRFGSPPS